jgi:WD40 repeat protein
MVHGCEANRGHELRLTEQAIKIILSCAKEVEALPARLKHLAVAFSPNGQLLATAGVDGEVRLWDMATRRQTGTVITVPGYADDYGVTGVAFSPNGQDLATGGLDGTVRLWDMATQRQIGTASSWPLRAATKRYGCGTWRPSAR